MNSRPELARSIGRLSLAALVLNSIIGTGVFILPGTIADRLGWLSMLAWVLAAAFTGVMVLCFAEVASRFTGAGGAYLYTRTAFGSFAGVQMGWMTYFVRAISAAVQANLFAAYLAELAPWAATRAGGIAATSLFIGVITTLNVRSVLSGARVSNAFAVAKIAPLLGFSVLGMVWILAGKAGSAPPASDPTAAGWLQALLLLMFAYGGFESALIPLAEARAPQRDAPFALLAGLGLVVLVYLSAQLTVLVTLPDPGETNRPLAESARVILGAGGAAVITAAALVSVSGWLASNLLTVPRLTMAMAERGDLPAVFGRIHPTFRTPYVSIIGFALLSWVLANQAGLIQNLSLSAVSRLFVYGLVCAALPALRRKERDPASGVGPATFHARFGPALAALGVGVSLVLATRMTLREVFTMAILVTLASVSWWAARRRERAARVRAGAGEPSEPALH